MPVSLTYEAYPNILDAIIVESDSATQRALRLVCRSFRDAIKCREALHIILTPQSIDGAFVHGATARTPLLRRLHPTSLTQFPSHPTLLLLQRTRVVDVRGLFPQTCNLPSLKGAFPGMKVLRLATSNWKYTPYIPFGAETLVLFTSPYGPDCEAKTPPSDARFAPQQPYDSSKRPVHKGVDQHAVPRSVTRVVVNMGSEDQSAANQWPLVAYPPPHVKDIILILPRIQVSEGGKLQPCPLSSRLFLPDLVAEDVSETLVGSPHVSVTVVGLEFGDTEASQDFRRHLRTRLFCDLFSAPGENASTINLGGRGEHQLLVTNRRMSPTWDMVEENLRRVKMMSWEEYVQQVGLGRASIETVEYHDGSKREGKRPVGLPNDLRRQRIMVAKGG